MTSGRRADRHGVGFPASVRSRRSSDDELVARVRAGHRRAFEEIYDRHQPAILSFCRHLTGHREDAEDALQHTFMAAYRQLSADKGDGRHLELRPWLFTVARNRCLTLLRRRGREVRSSGVEPSVDGLASEVERRDELRHLVRDLGRLPEEQRAALLLAELNAMSHVEIAGVLGVEARKVKALVFQARASLAASREAREAPCQEVRTQLATLTGPARRRRSLRRHLRDCSGCSEFDTAMRA
jgi:RNA polymerase sigma factor (sigma-70 family)